MTTITMRLDGMDELLAAIDAKFDQVEDALGAVVARTAVEIESEVKLRMQQGPHTGRTYRRGNVVHRASAPGQPPAPDTGVLMGSIYHEKDTPTRYDVGSRIAYASYLEFGTRKMAARPVWLPVTQDAGEKFRADCEAAIRGAAK